MTDPVGMAPMAAGTTISPSPSALERILVVEDDEAFLHSCTKVLTEAGFDVCPAADYRAALAALEGAGRIDLMLADLVMPQRVNGLALARMARLRRPGLKIVYLTAYDIPGAAGEALGPILHKPIENDQLVREIRRALDTN